MYLFAFLIPVVILYYIIPIKYRWGVLLTASIVFYLFSSKYLIVSILFTSLLVYLAAKNIEDRNLKFKEIKKSLEKPERKLLKEKNEKKNNLVCGLVAIISLGILFFSKYLNFAGNIANSFCRLLNINMQFETVHLLMPLGISFYTLSAIAYVIDVKRGVCEAEKKPLKIFLFLSFFPTVTEGPIERYKNVGKMLSTGHSFDYKTFCFGLQLMMWGLFKKIVVADNLNRYVMVVFRDYKNFGNWVIILMVLVYTLELYADFSGCIDIARGSAELFGIELSENFKQPFVSKTVNEFWQRWNITLGSFLRDYVFYPVSLSTGFQNLSKKSKKVFNNYYATTVPMIFALFMVWLCNGLWHGSEVKYVVYGLYYYAILTLGLLLEPLFKKIFESLNINRESKGYQRCQIARTFILVNIGMMIFNSKDIASAKEMFFAMFKPSAISNIPQELLNTGMQSPAMVLLFIIPVIIFAFVGHFHEQGISIREYLAQKPLFYRWSFYLAGVAVIISLGAYGVGFKGADFIYAQF